MAAVVQPAGSDQVHMSQFAPNNPAHSENTNNLEPNMHNEQDLIAKIERTVKEAHIQNESLPDNGGQSVSVPLSPTRSFLSMFPQGCVCRRGNHEKCKTIKFKSKAILAETTSSQQRLPFQPSVQADQITRDNECPRGEIKSVPQALLGVEEVPDTHKPPQVVARSRSKRRIVNIDPSQNEGV